MGVMDWHDSQAGPAPHDAVPCDLGDAGSVPPGAAVEPSGCLGTKDSRMVKHMLFICYS